MLAVNDERQWRGGTRPTLSNFSVKSSPYLPVSLMLHSVVDFIYFVCKNIKLRDDEFVPEGLDQQDDVSTNTPERKNNGADDEL